MEWVAAINLADRQHRLKLDTSTKSSWKPARPPTPFIPADVEDWTPLKSPFPSTQANFEVWAPSAPPAPYPTHRRWSVNSDTISFDDPVPLPPLTKTKHSRPFTAGSDARLDFALDPTPSPFPAKLRKTSTPIAHFESVEDAFPPRLGSIRRTEDGIHSSLDLGSVETASLLSQARPLRKAEQLLVEARTLLPQTMTKANSVVSNSEVGGKGSEMQRCPLTRSRRWRQRLCFCFP
jgi:hypothetical protein